MGGVVWFGGGAETASGPVDPSDTGTVLSDPTSGSLGTPEIVPTTTQSVSGKEYAVSGWCHANLAGGQSPELTGRDVAMEPGGQL